MDPSQRVSHEDSRKLLYATHGYTTHDRRFITAAVAHGWTVDVVRFDGGGVDLEDRPLPGGARWHEWLGTTVAFRVALRGEFVAAMREVIAQLDPDVIQAGPLTTVADVATQASGVVPVVAVSWGWDLLVDVPRGDAERAAAQRAVTLSAAVLVDCLALRNLVENLGVDRDRILVVPWGVELDRFPFVEPRADPRPLHVLSLRSFEPIYDVITLIEATAKVRDEVGPSAMWLSLAGGGSLEVELVSRVEVLGLNEMIAWPGRVSEHAVHSLLARHDVHVSTSLSDGTSISLLQAMATGRPSVVTDLPSNREWVTPESTGWLFPSGDSDALANHLLTLVNEPELLAPTGRNARLLAEGRADWSVNNQEIDELYDRIRTNSAPL